MASIDAGRPDGEEAAETTSMLQRISNLMVSMQKEHFGRGPDRTKSYMFDDLLLVVMRGGVTRAEQTMLDFGQEDLVRNFRQQFENEMTKKLVSGIEQLTGRTVLTYQCQILFNPHMVCQIFVFRESAGAAVLSDIGVDEARGGEGAESSA